MILLYHTFHYSVDTIISYNTGKSTSPASEVIQQTEHKKQNKVIILYENLIQLYDYSITEGVSNLKTDQKILKLSRYKIA